MAEPTTFVKQGGVWRTIDELQVHDGNQWRYIYEGYVKDAGVWRKVFMPRFYWNIDQGGDVEEPLSILFEFETDPELMNIDYFSFPLYIEVNVTNNTNLISNFRGTPALIIGDTINQQSIVNINIESGSAIYSGKEK